MSDWTGRERHADDDEYLHIIRSQQQPLYHHSRQRQQQPQLAFGFQQREVAHRQQKTPSSTASSSSSMAQCFSFQSPPRHSNPHRIHGDILEEGEGPSLDDSLTDMEWVETYTHIKPSLVTPVKEKKKVMDVTSIATAQVADILIAAAQNQFSSAKPPFSYSSLIMAAIVSSPTQMMTLNDIYSWIEESFPHYKFATNGWKNSIRHNLSLSEYYAKVPRQGGEKGKGSYWSLNPEAIASKGGPQGCSLSSSFTFDEDFNSLAASFNKKLQTKSKPAHKSSSHMPPKLTTSFFPSTSSPSSAAMAKTQKKQGKRKHSKKKSSSSSSSSSTTITSDSLNDSLVLNSSQTMKKTKVSFKKKSQSKKKGAKVEVNHRNDAPITVSLVPTPMDQAYPSPHLFSNNPQQFMVSMDVLSEPYMDGIYDPNLYLHTQEGLQEDQIQQLQQLQQQQQSQPQPQQPLLPTPQLFPFSQFSQPSTTTVAESQGLQYQYSQTQQQYMQYPFYFAQQQQQPQQQQQQAQQQQQQMYSYQPYMYPYYQQPQQQFYYQQQQYPYLQGYPQQQAPLQQQLPPLQQPQLQQPPLPPPK
eukprot:m.95400 g.95400  ORF g.95400 m.95400 type:complete len:581 (+) comp8946_c0_seq2:39-1781(+)